MVTGLGGRGWVAGCAACWFGERAGSWQAGGCRVQPDARSPPVSLSQSAECVPVQGDLGLGVLLPHLAAVLVERTEVGEGVVRAWARARADGAACPRCGGWCTRVHGRYTRRLADGGTGGRRVVIWLRVRVLCCGNAQC